ncbi:hypothetical protein J5N97_027611 [Dioscorea zingiberensis]|uniref:Cellulose synthase n=1 Tax=Dioscorea zingiberensis TaxID=325984 RepID=A0A9D5C505_9LILI|nr:hypothetical protein J5N97_027611 [Dioscorea zingiberensis]
MEASAGLVAGSHNRNELVLIRGHEEPKPLRALNGQVCEICGDEVGMTVDGDLFVACNECGFPSKSGGDDDEEDIDDIEHEFNIEDEEQNKRQHQHQQQQNKHITEAMLYGKMSYGRGPDNGDTSPPQFPPIITAKSRPVSGELPLMSNGHNYGDFSSTLHKRVHPYPVSEPEIGSATWDEKKEMGWRDRMDEWKSKQGLLGADTDDIDADMPIVDEARQPLSRKVPIASSKINPYRMIIVVRLVVLGFFLRYRILNPVHDAIGLWLTSIVCEIWFAISWILDQFPKWFPIDRETYLDRLSLRYEREGEPSMLSPVDLFVSTVDPLKEPPLVTANTVLSILAVDYPVDKVSCYVSDDGASMLTFEALSETSEFARKWVPFCKKFNIEPRAPEMYFSLKVDYLKDKVQPTLLKNAVQMKVRVSAVLTNAPFMLNLDCDHYINNSKAIREAMCFLMDPQVEKEEGVLCSVPSEMEFKAQCIMSVLGVSLDDKLCMVTTLPKGPKRPKMVTCDCCPCFGRIRRMPSMEMANSQQTQWKTTYKEDVDVSDELEKRFGQSAAFVTSTLMEEGGVPPSSSPA